MSEEEMEMLIEYEITKLANVMYGTIMNKQGFRKLIKGILEIAKKQNEATNDRI